MGAGVARITHRETIGSDSLPYMDSISALDARAGPAGAELRVYAGSGADGGLSVFALEPDGPARFKDEGEARTFSTVTGRRFPSGFDSRSPGALPTQSI